MNIIRGKIEKAQKVLIYGPEGIGKSTFASKFPNPLYSDTEGSTAHLNVGRFDKPTSWPLLMAQAEFVKKEKPCATYVIDTADWAEKLCKEYIISQSPSAKSIEDFGYGKGYTMLAEEWGRWLNKLQEIIDSGINVVITAHAMMRKFEQPSELGAYDRWELKLEKKTAPMTKEWADAVLFATYEIHVVNVDNQGASKGKNKAQGGARVMYTTHNPAWDAKNRWGLADKLPFDYQSIATHIPLEIKADNSKQVIEKLNDMGMSVEVVTNDKPKAAEYKEDFSFFSKPLQDLLYANKITANQLSYYITKVKGHFPVGTPLQNLPKDYTDGALLANWDKVISELNPGAPEIDLSDDELTF